MKSNTSTESVDLDTLNCQNTDVEAQSIVTMNRDANTAISGDDNPQLDQFSVGWNGPDDQENPKNWPSRKSKLPPTSHLSNRSG
jgi:hypothetical protein